MPPHKTDVKVTMLKPSKKPIRQTVILCLVTLLITFPKYGGFMLGFVFLFLMPSLLKSLYFIFIKNKEKKQRSIQTLLWVIACSISIIHHVYLYKTTQAFAEQVSNAVIMFYQKNGAYPESYETLGFDEQTMKKYGLYYSYKDQKPFLFYPATWMVYDVYMFDFKNQKWVYQAS